MNQVEHFLIVANVTPGLVLRVDQGPVDLDVVDPAATRDETCLDPQLPLDVGRQTGGPWPVVSLTAVRDRDVHPRLPLPKRAEIVT